MELLYIIGAIQFTCCILTSWLVEVVCEMKFLISEKEMDCSISLNISLPCPDIL